MPLRIKFLNSKEAAGYSNAFSSTSGLLDILQNLSDKKPTGKPTAVKVKKAKSQKKKKKKVEKKKVEKKVDKKKKKVEKKDGEYRCSLRHRINSNAYKKAFYKARLSMSVFCLQVSLCE